MSKLELYIQMTKIVLMVIGLIMFGVYLTKVI